MAAVAEKKPATDDVVALLKDAGEIPVSELLGMGIKEPQLAAAWARGEIEFGRTKYVIAGNPDVPESKPTLIIEDGIEWSGPKSKYHSRIASILAETMPVCRFYQKYQKEGLVNKEKDAWEWVESDSTTRFIETRWARRTISRDDAAKLWAMYVRLTDKGWGNSD